MKVTLAQSNPIVGDIEGNLDKIAETLQECKGDSPDLVVFPELFITGYPPRDLLERRWFIEKYQAARPWRPYVLKDSGLAQHVYITESSEHQLNTCV